MCIASVFVVSANFYAVFCVLFRPVMCVACGCESVCIRIHMCNSFVVGLVVIQVCFINPKRDFVENCFWKQQSKICLLNFGNLNRQPLTI